MLYSFRLDQKKCRRCKVDLCGEGMVKVDGDLWSVNEKYEVVESATMQELMILDHKVPKMSCSCGASIDCSYQPEGEGLL